MLLYRTAPDGAYAATDPDGTPRRLFSNPWQTPVSKWQLGGSISLAELLPPVEPSKIVGIGRNYVAHAAELGNEMPKEPLVFLKAPSSLLAPGAAIVLPPESQRVELEGEIGLVMGRRLHRASREECAAAILGVTAANDVTARDLQRRDKTFARGKSFDSFCPVGPAVLLGANLASLVVETRLDDERVQTGQVSEMAWSPIELVQYVSRHMTLVPGDLLLTGTPAGVTPLSPGQQVTVTVSGVPPLVNPVVAFGSGSA